MSPNRGLSVYRTKPQAQPRGGVPLKPPGFESSMIIRDFVDSIASARIFSGRQETLIAYGETPFWRIFIVRNLISKRCLFSKRAWNVSIGNGCVSGLMISALRHYESRARCGEAFRSDCDGARDKIELCPPRLVRGLQFVDNKRRRKK